MNIDHIQKYSLLPGRVVTCADLQSTPGRVMTCDDLQSPEYIINSDRVNVSVFKGLLHLQHEACK